MAENPGAIARKGLSLRRLRRFLLRRFRRDERGATAVEFGFIAVPFFMLMMATTELALMLWTSQQMEEALFQGTRVMLTGESLTKYSGTPAAAGQKFRDDLCAKMTMLVDCTSRLKVDVKTYPSFATATSNMPVSGGVLNTAGFGWQPVTPSSIVVVRAVLSYPMALSSWNKAFADLADGSRALMASVAFRTEPFPAS
jgi:pilus assembly protein Flp/PilA